MLRIVLAVLAVPVALALAACGSSERAVVVHQPAQPVVVQQQPQPVVVQPGTVKTETKIEHDD